MNAEINKLELSSESDDCDHPNIDKRSFIAYKRAQKEHKKKVKRDKLEQLKISRKSVSNNEELTIIDKEIAKLEFELDEKIKETESCTTFSAPVIEEEDKYVNDLCFLLNNNTLSDFIDYLDRKQVNLNDFEDIVLHNLSENIKEGNDEIGLDLARLSLFVKYAKNEGRGFLTALCVTIKDKEKNKLLEEECKNHYERAKEAILALQDKE